VIPTPSQDRKLRGKLDGPNGDNEEQAREISGHQLQGTRMDPTQTGEEKMSDYDGGGFMGDGTKLMPALRRIHKMGSLQKRGAYSTFDIEDMGAAYQSRLNPPTQDQKPDEKNSPEFVGRSANKHTGSPTNLPMSVPVSDQDWFNPPARDLKHDSDVATRDTGLGSGDTDDNPVTEVEPQEPQDARVRQAKGLNKRGMAELWLKAKTAAYKLDAQMEFQGLHLDIEHTAGSIRRGKDKDGHEWATTFRYAYGYIRGTKGADGEGLDVFVGPNPGAEKAFVIHQKKPDTGKYDEDKIMLGWDTAEAAKEAYLDHYDNPKFFGDMTEISMDRLRDLAKEKGKLAKIANALQKRADAVLEAGPEVFGREPRVPKFKMPSSLRKVGALATNPQAPITPTPATPSVQPSNPVLEARHDVMGIRKVLGIVRKLEKGQIPL
jgi:Inorganic Pyrophosphatase